MKGSDFIILSVLLLEKTKNSYVYNEFWFTNVLILPECQFIEYFRMKKYTFLKLSEILFSKCIEYNSFIRFKEDFMMFLGFISHEGSYRSIKELFGVPKTSYFRRINFFTTSVFNVADEFIKLPTEDEFNYLNNGFAQYGEHKIILLVDGCHINIARTQDADYYNRKQRYSVNWLFVTDFKHRFRYACNSFGAAHDQRAWRTSDALIEFANNLEEFKILGDQAFSNIRNVEIVVARPRNSEERIKNAIYKPLRVNIENSFGMFKNKFRRFLNKFINGNTSKNLKKTIVAIVILTLLKENE